MKKMLTGFISVLMAAVMVFVMTASVFADAPEYISEVKIGMGKNASDAEKALAGYKILTDEKGNKVDLNQDAGGGAGSKGEKVVYLGYKTTTDKGDAITDLALMNMKGGYSVEEYEALMELQMKSQIIPFVDKFICAIKEYRDNCKSEEEANRQRGEYIRDMLNKLTDDDCGGKGLGDLLLNKTKYEMGDAAYNALSAEEKKNHADILTILAQCNGHAALIFENLVVRGADSNPDTWVDRFAEITYDDLIDAMDMPPTDAERELAKLYEDDARKVLGMWGDFRDALEESGKTAEHLDVIDEDEFEEDLAKIEDFDITNASDKDIEELADVIAKTEVDVTLFTDNLSNVLARGFLDTVDYEDGTLLDFFTRPVSEVSGSIEQLFPLVASLSDGQRAGLEFVSLTDLVLVAGMQEGQYKDSKLEEMEPMSIYEGVDRGIYQKGGVALTSDALRTKAEEVAGRTDNFPVVSLIFTILSAGLSIASLAGLIKTFKSISAIKSRIAVLEASIASGKAQLESINTVINNAMRHGAAAVSGRQITYQEYDTIMFKLMNQRDKMESVYFAENNAAARDIEKLAERSAFCRKLAIGFSIAMVILGALAVYLSYIDMVEYYDVEFTPIPHYMVDEKDITTYNEDGEMIVEKNQSAYYKAVECNRTGSDEFYKTLGTCADMNGDVGKQWLALYAQKSTTFAPILASSLLVKVDSADVPAGYTTGIHMFGSASAFNLNSELYDWNKSAPSVMVYFKTESSPRQSEAPALLGAPAPGGLLGASNDTAAEEETAGTTEAAAAERGISKGALIITGICGLAAGVIIPPVIHKARSKKKTDSE